MSKLTTQRLRELLTLHGWREDAYGHMQKSVTRTRKATAESYVAEMRVKMQDISVRVEVRGERQSDGTRPWIRVGGGYLKDCAELPDQRVRLGGFIVGKPAEHTS